jgi:hypothetical protein
VVGIIGDDAVVASQGEVLLHEVQGGDECGLFVDHNGLFVRHVELGLDHWTRYPGILKLLEGLVIGPISPGPLRIEHGAHVDAGFRPVDYGRDQSRLGESELLDEKRIPGRIDELANRFQAVVWLGNQTLRERGHDFGMLAPGE